MIKIQEIPMFEPNVQSSVKWRKKIIQPVWRGRCKEETSIFKTDMEKKNVFADEISKQFSDEKNKWQSKKTTK